MIFWVANYAFETEFEAEQDDPSTRDMEDYAKVSAVGTSRDEVVRLSKERASAEFRDIAETDDFQVVWEAPKYGWWEVRGKFTADGSDDECLIVVREMGDG